MTKMRVPAAAILLKKLGAVVRLLRIRIKCLCADAQYAVAVLLVNMR